MLFRKAKMGKRSNMQEQSPQLRRSMPLSKPSATHTILTHSRPHSPCLQHLSQCEGTLIWYTMNVLGQLLLVFGGLQEAYAPRLMVNSTNTGDTRIRIGSSRMTCTVAILSWYKSICCYPVLVQEHLLLSCPSTRASTHNYGPHKSCDKLSFKIVCNYTQLCNQYQTQSNHRKIIRNYAISIRHNLITGKVVMIQETAS